MSPREVFALRDHLGPELKGRSISDARHVVSLTDIRSRTCFDGRPGELSGRSVLISVTGQLMAGLAMIEIDGIARRMLLCPPDLNPDYLSALIEDAETLTYRQFDRAMTETTEALRGLGIRGGDRVMIVSDNCIALACLLFATSRLDAQPGRKRARESPQVVQPITRWVLHKWRASRQGSGTKPGAGWPLASSI